MYTIGRFETVIRNFDGAVIPKDVRNGDYRDFLEWAASGGIPAPYVAPAVRVILSQEFQDRFLPDELRYVISLQSSGDIEAGLLLFTMQSHQYISLDSPEIQHGFDYLVSLGGVITQAVKERILS